jgi:hypothetical protein
MSAIGLATGFLTLNGDWHRFGVIALWALASLMLWACPAWDADWAATITGNPRERLIGLLRFGIIRMTYDVPMIFGLSYFTGHPLSAMYALATPLLAVPYYVFGYLTPDSTVIRNSEFTAGLILGGLICMVTL